jgi:hypothetical protein
MQFEAVEELKALIQQFTDKFFAIKLENINLPCLDLFLHNVDYYLINLDK